MVGERYIRRRLGFAGDRALLYLWCASETGDPPVHALSQEGIAHAIDSGRSTVAKALLRLDALDLVDARREHVPGHRLRKHVYRLTQAGWKEAARVRSLVGRRVVRLQGLPDGEVRVRLEELPHLFPGCGDLASLAARVHLGTIDSQALLAPPSEPCLPTVWGLDLPRPLNVVGRDAEAEQLDGWLRTDSRPLVLTGLAGIGKTALVSSAVARWRARYAVLWYAIRPWSSRATMTAEVAKFLAAAGRRGLERALLEQPEPSDEVLVSLLRESFLGFRALFVFDDVHAARPSVRRWLGLLASTIGPGPGRLLLVGRSAPRFTAPGVPRPVEVRLGPVSGPAARKILQLHGGDPDDPLSGTIIREARGNPLLLILGRRAGAAGPREIERFLEDEVWSALSEDERRALEAVSCFRRPAPKRALLSVPGVGADALDRLERRSLVGRTAGGGYTVHGSIESFVRRRVSVRRHRTCHAAASRYFLASVDPAARLEAVHHALEAGTPNVAADLLRREGEVLFNSVSFAALRDVVKAADRTRFAPAAAAVFLEAQADALRRGGAVRPAAALYAEARRLAAAARHRGDQGRIVRKIAELDRLAGRFDRARQRLLEAVALTDASDLREVSNLHREFALVEMARGELDEAEAHLKRSLRAARNARDPARFSRTLLVFGTLEAARGEMERGFERKRRALEHAELSGELAEIARDAISVGVSLAEMRRFKEAITFYDQGLRTARLLGDVRLVSFAQLDRGAALADLGLVSEARPAFDEADRLADLLGEKATRAFVAIGRGQLDMGIGRWRRAVEEFERGLEILRNHGSPYELARSLIDVGGYYAARGESAVAEERWQEALRLAGSLGNDSLAREIREKLALDQGAVTLSSESVGSDARA